MPRKDIAKDGKPFKKGDPRINRKGRPKVLPLLNEAIEKVINEEQGVEEIIRALYNRAIKGDTLAARELLDRYYGKAKQNLDVTSNGDTIIMPIIKIEREDE